MPKKKVFCVSCEHYNKFFYMCNKGVKYSNSAIYKNIPKYPLCEKKNKNNNCKEFEIKKPRVRYSQPRRKFLGIF